ncbi:zinc finger protein 271-like [Stegodyphus dumicola]|uniref:zinc finger protein 271-like n=1 Tax=Stegodyphus dumicola TaxID=202533 RepID=UPI0015A8FF5E|nr:zinc finger protein 271-like [Stegodyphus dumicola]
MKKLQSEELTGGENGNSSDTNQTMVYENISLLASFEERPRSCPYCSYATSHKGNLKKHIRIHTGERPFSCNICKKKFQNQWLDDQCYGQYQGMMINILDRQQSCVYRILTLADLFPRNQGIIYQNDLFCTSENLDVLNPDLHSTYALEEERPFACNICTRKFRRKGDLQRHILTHTGLKSHICDLCSKAFSRSDVLKVHRLSCSHNKLFASKILHSRK